MGKDADQIRREIADTRDDIGDTVDAIGYRANIPGRVKDTIADTFETTRRKVSDALPDADDVRDGMRTAVNAVQDNPLLFALGAFVVGLIIGLVIPGTRMESDAMGSTARGLKEKARQTGREVIEQGSQMLQETADTMKSSARRHGQEVMSNAKERMRDLSDDMSGSASSREGQGI